MNIERVKLYNFRNYRQFDFTFTNGVHIFTGNNAQGKTNLLEAIFLAVLGKSFRAGNDDEMIFWDQESAIVEIDFSNIIAGHSLKIELIRNEKRKNTLNGKNINKRDIVGQLNAVLFCPEDLWLIKGGPVLRRRFIDFLISQVDKKYYQDYIRFNRVILQRNNLLKKINLNLAKIKQLDIWDDELIALSEKIFIRRKEFLIVLSDIAGKIYTKISCGAERFSSHYSVFGIDEGFKDDDTYRVWYQNRLSVARQREIMRGSTEVGPHKDDISFRFDEHEAKLFGSQGQQRTAILALKLAEIELMTQITGEKPILLLDDVMSELDEFRRRRLIQEINGNIQTFITGTVKETTLEQVKATFYSVSEGKVSLN